MPETVDIYQRAGSEFTPVRLGAGCDAGANAVTMTGDQIIAGVKTFTDSPKVPLAIPKPEPHEDGAIYTDDWLNSIGEAKLGNAANVELVRDGIQILVEEIQTSFLGLMEWLGNGVNNARDEASAAKTLAEGAVPKSGGAMTGTLSLPRMEVRDAAQNPFVDFTKHATRDFDARLYVDIDEEANPNNASGKGTLYAWHNIPANSYSYAVATTMSVVDYAAKKAVANVSVYVDAVNGSDTADLNKGRGLSPEKPFKSLEAAEKWVMATYCSPVVVIIYLLSDITYSQSVALAMPSLTRLQIAGYASKKTITMAAPFSILTGVLAMTNLNLAASPDAALASFIHMDNRLSGSAAFLGLANLSFSGTVTNASLYMTGANCKAFLQAPITGTVTGKKYVCANGAVLDTYGGGPTAVPGSEAGQVDANSKII